LQGGGLQAVEVGVVDQQDVAGFLDVDDELRVLVAGGDGGSWRGSN